jgi:hypothetical protein
MQVVPYSPVEECMKILTHTNISYNSPASSSLKELPAMQVLSYSLVGFRGIEDSNTHKHKL